MTVSAIVPAYNEANRIGSVLSVLNSEKIGEIIVVDDGSTDGTAKVAEQYDADIIRLCENKGKAYALQRGVDLARYETLLFMDADLIGLTCSHVEKMLSAYWEGDSDIVIGVFHNGRLNTDLSQKINPHLSGQRVFSATLWQKANQEEELEKFGVEIAMTRLIHKERLTTEKVKLEGVTHVMKEEKRGFGKGFLSRLEMYGNIIKTFFSRHWVKK